VEQVYLHDFNNSGTVSSGDINGFMHTLVNGLAGPTGATGACN
jgi:hypothetical protein